MKPSHYLGHVLALIIFVFAIPYLNGQVASVAEAEGASKFAIFVGDIFPLFLIFGIIGYAGVVIWQVMKDVG